MVTVDQAREAKEELKDVFARHSGFVTGIGLVALANGSKGFGVVIRLSRQPDPIEKMQFPEVYTTRSKVNVPVQYMIVSNV